MSLSTLMDMPVKYGYYRQREMLLEYSESKVMEKVRLADESRQLIDTPEKHKEYVEQLRAKYIENLGVLPYDHEWPLNVAVVDILEEDDLTLEKIIFESRENVYITANIYVPKNRSEKSAAILFVLGHSEEGKADRRYQKVARRIAKRGLIVMLYDPTGQGERLNYVERNFDAPMVAPTVWDHIYFGNQCILMGDSPAGYFIADAMRAVDYLESRPDVDRDRIGITGSSGGGTMTCHMMICDPRIKAAAPGTFITSREMYMKTRIPQDAEQIWLNSLCYGFDFHDIMACFAPKPTMILAVEYDFFLIEGTEDVVKDTRHFWNMYGSDELHFVVDKSVHKYTDVLATYCSDFFGRIFDTNTENKIACDKFWPEEEIRCTKTGQIVWEFENAVTIFDENKRRFEQCGGALKGKLEEFLKEKSYFERETINLHLKYFEKPIYEYGLKYTPIVWLTQKGLPNYAYLITEFNVAKVLGEVIVILTDGGTKDIERNIYKIRRMIKTGKSVLVVDFSGMGQSGPQGGLESSAKEMYDHYYNINMNLLLCGDSICALHLFEMDTMVNVLSENVTDQISFYAEGRMANLALLYREMNPNIEVTIGEYEGYEEIIRNKYYEGYNFPEILLPGILKYL